MTTTTVIWERTKRDCENCGDSTEHYFTVECTNCGEDMTVCEPCVNREPQHDACPVGEEED